jgi:hypothetical protein
MWDRHSLQSALSSMDSYPAKQVQSSICDLGVPAELVPSGQSEHAVLVRSDLYCSSVHGTHSPMWEIQPFLQKHCERWTLPVGDSIESFLSSQAVHAPVPASILYVPDRHALHSPGDVSVYPASTCKVSGPWFAPPIYPTHSLRCLRVSCQYMQGVGS